MLTMIHKAVEISGDRQHIHKSRGFLVVSKDHEEIGKLPLDDLEIVLVSGHGMSFSANLLFALTDRCIPLILCDANYQPSAILSPIVSHHAQSGRIRAQACASKPLCKRVWKQIVQAKIIQQAEALDICGKQSKRVRRLADGVLSGDTSNVEGEAARLYWTTLFGSYFRRERQGDGINALLNFGYAIIRSSVARALMRSGLHPAFGLHHCNTRNAMPLVDDLMEVFRPIIDITVYNLQQKIEPDEILTLTPENKELLIRTTDIDMKASFGISPVSECMFRMTRSLVDIYIGNKKKLILPEGIHPPE